MSQNLISTIKVETYDSNSVRVGWLEKEDTLSYKQARQSYISIPAATDDQELDLINTTIEYLAIYSAAEIKIRINDVTNPEITINGQFVISGAEITSLFVSNEHATAAVVLDIIQGDETA